MDEHDDRPPTIKHRPLPLSSPFHQSTERGSANALFRGSSNNPRRPPFRRGSANSSSRGNQNTCQNPRLARGSDNSSFRGHHRPPLERGSGNSSFRGNQNTSNRSPFEHNVQRGSGNTSSRGKYQHRGARPKFKSPAFNSDGRPMSLQTLLKLQDENPEIVLVNLLSKTSGFDMLVQHHECPEDITMENILVVLHTALTVDFLPQNVTSLLQMLNESLFFTQMIPKYIVSKHTYSSVSYSDIDNIIVITEKLLRHLPSSSVQSSIPVISQLTSLLERADEHVRDQMSSKVKSLMEVQSGVLEQVHADPRKGQQHAQDNYDNSEPVNDFRSISIIPTAEDVLTKQQPFLRRNKVFGGYKSVDHYLDVQFRLLREDFIGPLREGIQEYLQTKKVSRGEKKKKLTDVRVYTDVHIGIPIFTHSGTVYAVHFDVSLLNKVNWETSKRLIYGSLICLSSDNFQTLLFGTVAERHPKALGKGIVYVQFEEVSMHRMAVTQRTAYEMIESAAYFEAYRHNLEGLQQMKEKNLPMKKYILNCETSQIDSPQYIRGRDAEYNFRSVLKNSHSNQRSNVKVLRNSDWPSASQMGLDDSQHRALQTAVTKEFAIIQGPPGTGKTFLGLKIMQVLLDNVQEWNALDHQPILVVCFTNHALDQFLEGTLELTDLQPGELLRVGGQGKSENEQLQQCALRHHRNKADRSDRQMEIQNEMEHIAKTVEQQIAYIHSTEKKILTLTYLEHVIMPHHLKAMAACNYKNALKDWLLTTTTQNLPQKEAESGDREAPTEATMEQLTQAVEDERKPAESENIHEKYEKTMALCNENFEMFCNEQDEQQGEFQESRQNWRRLQKKFDTLIYRQLTQNKYDIMSDEEENKCVDIWSLNAQDRWRLYKLWVSRVVEDTLMRMRTLCQRHSSLSADYKELKEMTDFRVISESKVVGMTTTGAAKHRGIIQRVQPKIVIVEEAAEVLEAHIITTLSANCQHLILIGDHQQLRPNPTVYKLARDYKLDISLFERMVKNSAHCDQLLIQHRMRPEIVKLIVPHVYETLLNDPSVKTYDNINGVQGNLFFIEHHEHESMVDDLRSRSNQHEAEYVVELTNYFLQQGYEASRITVLAAYTGQMFLIKNLIRNRTLFNSQNVRVTPVDNYQGEENDIIILSLVRSNVEGRIGFLSISNRVCVALSRARMGFFVVGNINLLENTSDLWKNICRELREEGKIVEALPLCCQNHPTSVIHAKTSKDFARTPEGGCLESCNFRLPCGHVCVLKCHPYDSKHEAYECKKACPRKICDEGHPCPLKCFQKCRPCMALVEKRIPDCGHIQKVPCSVEAKNFKCKEPCPREICNLDHPCPRLCHEDCPQCTVPVEKSLPNCQHKNKVACHILPEDVVCPEPCAKYLACGHQCSSTCGAQCTVQCHVSVDKTWHCGHINSTECWKPTDNTPCTTIVKKTLDCGHSGEYECGIDQAKISCKIAVPFGCGNGHLDQIPCHKKSTFACRVTIQVECPVTPNHSITVDCCKKREAVCNEFCTHIFSCKHKCMGRCGDCHQNNQHPHCRAACREILSCGHKCHSPCGSPCEPCREFCPNSCGHKPCRHQCGMQNCLPCNKPCQWRCMHQQCTKQCWEVCDRGPCNKPCTKPLACGHPCISLCGEICPQLCRICHPEHISNTARRLHARYTDKTRFVLLQPCSHVVDVSRMDWLLRNEQITNNTVMETPRCPMCGHAIWQCRRYNKVLKQFIIDLQVIKSASRETYAPYEKSIAVQSSLKMLPEALVSYVRKNDLQVVSSDALSTERGVIGVIKLLAACASFLGPWEAFMIPNDPHKRGINQLDLQPLKSRVEHIVQCGNIEVDMAVVPHLMITYIQCHLRHMLTYMKNNYLIEKLIGMHREAEMYARRSPLDMYSGFENLNATVVQCFRGGPQNIWSTVHDCFEVQLIDYTKKVWLKCDQGHVFSEDKTLDIRQLPCTECYPTNENRKGDRTWIDEIRSRLHNSESDDDDDDTSDDEVEFSDRLRTRLQLADSLATMSGRRGTGVTRGRMRRGRRERGRFPRFREH